ncbi:formate dehydrogenase accessory sulfurtransferase FdhD [Paenibacillus mucilaginosus]|uniref:Sulfur carrier protein FdhD n=2 Tax=Paenibacillus mucilaginosus TaxID=61624 RepID=I0BA42_9BACL|nr:formate dehydrogenase accessory sulfurtransferase FdhD [Paenibacillus mucilaginosus]AEI38772.1 FdhD [Paenibacillus mucilaginosus KNP414]AFH59239.1 formate dehydrogenase subunit D [Paenibacillus mucilaginosus K02]MCG7215907.1 formate dehydrogenase accessory sulfurtransferase FdhD [Paenibacillus mucilaginosus]WDM27854.1 formate dehydrogenase accessory sulfurtransferase FdhD [Paenibacillus mucilaginosus]
MNDEAVTPRTIWRYDGGALRPLRDTIVRETPLTVRVNGEEFATVVCSPGDLEDFVVGFLASEGVLRLHSEITSLQLDPWKGFAYVELQNPLPARQRDQSKRFIGSCCGKSRQFYFQSDARTARTVLSRHTVTPDQCLALMALLQEGSDVFRSTGGVHNAALCSTDALLVRRSDIGRHNALDKLFGHSLRQGLPLHDKLLAFSGRVSSEVLLKAAKMGIGLLLSKSAPTDLALNLADDLGITVIGFIRGSSFNVYSHPERVQPTAGSARA